MAQYNCSGIVSTADQTNATYLPLESLDVHVFIADVSARVFLKQVYSHHGSGMLAEAFYVFPVPARAAVCSFGMETRNGVELKGVVKELSEAKEMYEEARSKGWLGGLLEQFRQDAFVMSIGSLPPNTDVTVLISYVVDLSEDDQIDSVRFQLSSHVRARYGAPSNSALYHDKIHHALLSITVDIEMPGVILGVTSINHNPFRDVPVTSNPSALDPQHHIRKQFVSPNLTDLQKDFLLIVYALGLGKPRCLAEHLSHEENSLRGITGPTTALACTIVPQFGKARSPMQEYLFLIDRSGSMAGLGIAMAKETLKLLLKQLPSTNAMFNIFSFGSKCESQWPSSKLSTEATVREASDSIQFMDANLGGTEMLGALQTVFRTRRRDIPTCVFVLTDGEIYNIDETVAAVRNVVTTTPVTTPLRVFTLGMGSGASSELCQRLALAGNGSHMMTVDGEPLAVKAMRLVGAMQIPQVEEMKIDWGGPSANESRQAPHRIPALSPGMRLLVTAIIPGLQTPAEVTIKIRLLDGATLDYRVPVQMISHIPASSTVDFCGQANIPPLIHTLSAHLLIQEVEGGDKQPLGSHAWVGLSSEARRDAVKRYIVELGTHYQIASSCTAFVAIETPKPIGNQRNNASRQASQQNASQGSSSTQTTASHGPVQRNQRSNGTQDDSKTSGASSHSPTGGNSNKSPENTSKRAGTNSPKASKDSPATQQKSTGSKGSSPHHSQGHKDSVDASSQTPGENESQSPTSQMPGAYKHSPDARTTAPKPMFNFFVLKPSSASTPVQDVLCVPDPQGGSPMVFIAPPLHRQTTIITFTKSWLQSLRSFVFSKGTVGGSRRNDVGTASAFPVAHKPLVPKAIMEMIQLQSSSGSFSRVSRELSSMVDIPEMELRNSTPPSMAYGENNESIWATAIAVAFFRKRLVSDVALWEGMAEKASHFGSGACGGDDQFEAIVHEALKLFEH